MLVKSKNLPLTQSCFPPILVDFEIKFNINELMLQDIKVLSGKSQPLGFSSQGKSANFALFSQHASKAFLVLFNGIEEREIPLEKSSDIWHIGIENLPEKTQYAFRLEGPYDLGKGLLYRSTAHLSDPYARFPSTKKAWGEGTASVRSECQEIPPFDWEGIISPRIPTKDLIIYEMHARGFTKHPSSKVAHGGSFLGIIEKIPYLKKLGINAIELMPVFEFDETNNGTGMNYWGYSPLHFFAPMRRFASKEPIDEFKTLVKELHKNGIELLLDVVYNHTGENKNLQHCVNFRGIDNTNYYMIDENGHYRDFTGCFNTFNVNHPVAAQFIIDSLKFWAQEMKVDGFRFDLASIFYRDCDGKPISDPPILKAIESDPLLKSLKWIAEPWDAAGLYQPGFFAKRGKWMEWNGLFRDYIRQFIKGTDHTAAHFATALCGSEPTYQSTTPLSSINFITAHDGFTLRDLVSYQKKRNFDNGEMNRDGMDENCNWNCGFEGPTTDPLVHALRERQMRNFFLALFLSQGIPMLKMGDEYGHSSKGNNNPYVQDNEISWFLWDELEKNGPIFDFVSSLIAFRKNHPIFWNTHFLTEKEIEWHGEKPLQPQWDGVGRLIAFTLKGEFPIYVAFNGDDAPHQVELPQEILWKEIVRTENSWETHHFKAPEKGALVSSIELIPYSAFVAKGLKKNHLI